MSDRNLRDHLIGYYRGKSLPRQTASRLQAMAEIDGPAVGRIAHGRFGWRNATYGLAACIGIVSFSAAIYLVQGRQNDGNTGAASVSPRQGDSSGQVTQKPGAIDVAQNVRLVAFKFHLDGCPYSAKTASVFVELMEKYGDEAILFARYDMTTEATREKSHELAESLGIAWVYEGLFQSGMIKLVDRQRQEVLQTLTDRQQMPEMEDALASALPMRRSPRP